MKPRTPIQQEVARLSERLPKLTATQRAYAFRHCFKHYAIKRADGTNICTECGHSWKSEHDLADTVCGCTCPDCGMELEALRTRKRVFNENEYFCIITTCKQYQVIRFFFVKSRYKAGQAAEYSIYEVVQRWISPKGTTVTAALQLSGGFLELHPSAFFFGYQPFYYVEVVYAHIQFCNVGTKIVLFAGFRANR